MKKIPNPTDKHVGARVRMRRLMLGMSQEKLASPLGVTFQQIQKYENGTNRIGASRLQQISERLQVPVAFFFEGSGAAPAATGVIDPFTTLASMREGHELASYFLAIEDPAARRSVVDVARAIAGSRALKKAAA